MTLYSPENQCSSDETAAAYLYLQGIAVRTRQPARRLVASLEWLLAAPQESRAPLPWQAELMRRFAHTAHCGDCRRRVYAGLAEWEATTNRRVRTGRRVALPLAAAAALVLLVTLVSLRWWVAPQRQTARVRVDDIVLLNPPPSRGPDNLTFSAPDSVIVLYFVVAGKHSRYRVEGWIARDRGDSSLAFEQTVTRQSTSTRLAIPVSPEELPPGDYRFSLIGLDSEPEDVLEENRSLRVRRE